MPWYMFVLVGWLGFQIAAQAYYIDRPRQPKTVLEAVGASIEIGLAIAAILIFAL